MALSIPRGPLRLGKPGLQIKVASASSFDPASVSSATLKCNLDFSTLAGADGSAISSFTDPVSGASFTQASGPSQPLVKKGANGINNLACALFDGTNDQLETSGTLSVASGSISLLMVLKPSATTANQWIFDATTGRMLFMTATGSSNIGWYDGAFKDIGAAATTNLQLLEWVMTSGGNGQVWRDGVSLGSTGYTAKAFGARITLGGAIDAVINDPYPGRIGQVLLYQGALSNADRQYLEVGLKAKWGTP